MEVDQCNLQDVGDVNAGPHAPVADRNKPLGDLLWFNTTVEPDVVLASVEWVKSLESKQGTYLESQLKTDLGIFANRKLIEEIYKVHRTSTEADPEFPNLCELAAEACRNAFGEDAVERLRGMFWDVSCAEEFCKKVLNLEDQLLPLDEQCIILVLRELNLD